jgi:hypothetical protein
MGILGLSKLLTQSTNGGFHAYEKYCRFKRGKSMKCTFKGSKTKNKEDKLGEP